MPPAQRTRLLAALAAALTIAAGLTVRAVAGGWFGKYAGDALYTVLVYALIVLVWPRITPARAALGALAFSWAVELAQLTPVPAALSEVSAVARLVLGSTFSAADLVAYAAGAALVASAHTLLRRRREHRPEPVTTPP
ncbi:ribosomal maturation YjgA family protein [Streptosporangium sp. NPDC002607]